MKKLTGYEIRKKWLDFFASKHHEVIPSASLVPVDDPTLLWINAGVAPLKKFFDGREKPQNPRLCNAQKSIRTNDIDNVGKTARHHTFFEMLGNFSIGDYFRDIALEYAVELLFDEKWFGLDKDLIYITYYPDDLETYNKWISLGIRADHLIPVKDNFWEIGEGPCGPDTEVFFDRGEKYDPNHVGIKLLINDIENDRYIEIWNIVLSQFNSKTGVPRSEYKELPSKNIDTGSGLERLACIMQEVETNYDSDLFFPYIEFLEKYTGIKYSNQMAFRVIVDHIRSVTFAISDGALLSNEGRGYVLRRILRRAVRYGRKLGINEPFLYKMVSLVVEKMKDFYPYLVEKQALVEKLIKIEEENFLKTLENGEKRLADIISKLDGKVISGKDAFLLYDTFGFPLELTIEAAEESGIAVDEEGYYQNLEEQKRRARSNRQSTQSMNVQNADYLAFNEPFTFLGYKILEGTSKVTGVFKDGKRVNAATGECVFTTAESPFYAESGGQTGDIGTVMINGEQFNITNTFKMPNGEHAHVVDMEESMMETGKTVILRVDNGYRSDVAKNHSATHLLNQSLRNVLGNHVIQQGSQVTYDRLRFDFNHYQNLTNEEILKIEKMVNKAIHDNYQVNTIETSMSEAKKLGAQAVFGEKYGSVVRLVDMDYSKELCGGTHVSKTGDIEQFAILSIESKGSGIFRIEAATSKHIFEEMQKTTIHTQETIDNLHTKLANIFDNALKEEIKLKVTTLPKYELIGSFADVLGKRDEYEKLWEIVKDTEKAYDAMYRQKNSSSYDKFLTNMIVKDDTSYIVEAVNNVDVNVLKDIVDKLSANIDKIVIFFADDVNGRLVFIAKAKNANVHCGELVKKAAIVTGGNGGGRPDFAQSGGKDASKLADAMTEVKAMLGI